MEFAADDRARAAGRADVAREAPQEHRGFAAMPTQPSCSCWRGGVPRNRWGRSIYGKPERRCVDEKVERGSQEARDGEIVVSPRLTAAERMAEVSPAKQK